MSRYKVTRFSFDNSRYDVNTLKNIHAQNLKEKYGLVHLDIEEIIAVWEGYSDSMCASWMNPDKESVERVFNVDLEEIEKDC